MRLSAESGQSLSQRTLSSGQGMSLVGGDKPWQVEFYDRHRWSGEDISWNGHDVGYSQGKMLEDAWRDLEMALRA